MRSLRISYSCPTRRIRTAPAGSYPEGDISVETIRHPKTQKPQRGDTRSTSVAPLGLLLCLPIWFLPICRPPGTTPLGLLAKRLSHQLRPRLWNPAQRLG